MGKWPELEPEPKILTSWSRSRTKIDRLRNTDFFRFLLFSKYPILAFIPVYMYFC
jgi:hypothetical protein